MCKLLCGFFLLQVKVLVGTGNFKIDMEPTYAEKWRQENMRICHVKIYHTENTNITLKTLRTRKSSDGKQKSDDRKVTNTAHEDITVVPNMFSSSLSPVSLYVFGILWGDSALKFSLFFAEEDKAILINEKKCLHCLE